MERKGNQITVLTGKKKYLIDFLKFGYRSSDDPPGVGSMEDYKPEWCSLWLYNCVCNYSRGKYRKSKVKYGWDGKNE